MRKSLPKGMNPTRLENRHGGGVPDLELQWATGSAFVELKAPKSTPRSTLQTLQIRPHLFANSAKSWEDAMLKGLTCTEFIKNAPELEFTSSTQSASLASKDQKAWHARRYANGGLSFFLQKTPGPSSYRLLSPYLDQESGSLRLGLVCETKDVALMWYALRLCAEMHSLAALRLDVSRETFQET